MKLLRNILLTIIFVSGFIIQNSAANDCSYELFSISSTKDTKIIEFIEQLSDHCEFSIVITDPNAQKFLDQTINKTHIKNLTLNEVLNIILTENNLSYTLENNILKISYLITKTFEVNYTITERKGTGSTDITLSSQTSNQLNNTTTATQGASTQGNQGDSTTSSNGSGYNTQSGVKIESTDEVRFWAELDKELRSILNRPEDTYEAPAPIINKNAGLVTITATQNQMKRVEEYIEKLQKKMHLQVLIDVQILAVTMSKGKTTGIDWSQLYKLQDVTLSVHRLNSQNVSKFEGDSITEGVYNGFKDIQQLVSIKAGGSLKEVIKFLQSQGDVNSLSNPKILTLNNQPALITVGTEYFYKIQQSTNQQGATGGIVATTQNDAIQSVFAGVLLDITPEIAEDGSITLKINPSLSETAQDMSKTDSAERVMPPDLNRRQLSSVVTVKDGNRIILGGLINTRTTYDTNKIPLLGDIPVINYLFKYENKVKTVQELVIIIQPHIIQKGKKDISLAELGYTGLSNDIKKENKDTNTTAKTVKSEDNGQ
jgi:general secretion pathway protein D